LFAIRFWFAWCTLAFGIAIAFPGHAQEFPSKVIRIVVPYAPGGAPDVTARSVAQKMSENMVHQVIVENRPGAGGGIAAKLVMNSPADGYNMLIADSSVYAISPKIFRDFPADPVKDWAPVSMVGEAPIFLVANSKTGVASVGDLLELARTKPGMPYGSSGNGSPHHLAMELLKSLGGVKLLHVPYKGTGQSVPAILGGEVTVLFSALGSVMPHVRSGRLNLLAVASGRRTGLYPEIPTVAEAGVPGFEVNINIGLFVPQKTPRSVVDRLNREIVKAVKSPEVSQRLISLGIDPLGSSVEQFGKDMRNEIEQYAKLIRIAGVRVD
jgi:tripartite-type tricarboxylate transporter receptor subunit TctC